KKFKLGADKGSGGLWNNKSADGLPGKDPLVLADKPFGEWNAFRIRQVGSRTWVWLNDKLVVDGAIYDNFWDRSKPLPKTGPIHLQTHGGEIRWRNVKVREIGADEANEILRSGEGEDGYVSVFNGKDFEGWSGATGNYEVLDGGVMRCQKGKGGTVFYDKELSHYSARFDFKLPSGGNNGVAIHYPGKGDAAYAGLCELQILDNSAEKYAKLKESQYHGSAYGKAAAVRGYLRPLGEWNTQTVTVKDQHVKVELNGNIILDANLADVKEFMHGKEKHEKGLSRSSGFFGFAGHSDPVEFRNIAIKSL
ncbi:MAG: DUF1080 domain-containing protein, partial [Verrucomicrobiota bacterium]